MKYYLLLLVYLLTGGLIMGKVNIDIIRDCGEPTMSFQEFSIGAATWPAVIGAGIAVVITKADVKTCKKPS
jgi:hypothetical protein